MAKYNLLDDDDIFDEKDQSAVEENNLNIKSEEEISQIDTTDDIDISIDDDEDLLETEPSSSLDDQDFQTDLDITAIDNDTADEPAAEPEIEDSEPGSFVDYEAEPEAADEQQKYTSPPPFITDDYEDTKQEGLNYKPFIMAVIIIAALGGIWFALDFFLFSDSAPDVVEEPVKTPEQLQAEKEAAEKAAFLGRLAGKTSSDINVLGQILSLGKNNASVSSILLYNESLLFEVFGKTRDQVAKVNMSLKNSNMGLPFEVVGSETRPGSNGGVFGLFKTQLTAAGSSSNVKQAAFSSVGDFQSWVEQSTGASNLKIKEIKNDYLEQDGYFRKFKVETAINGSIDNCSEFLQKLSTSNNQVKIHKLTLTAADQRNFKANQYLLKLILEVYV